VLATFLSVFVGIPRATTARRIVFGALVVCSALLTVFSFDALRSTGGSASRLAHHLPLLGAAGLGGLVFLAAATWLAWRYPEWAMPAVIVLAPLRIGVALGSSTSNLLVPLYLLLIAVAIAEMVVRDRLVLPDGWRPDPVRIALAVMIAVVGLSSLWVGQNYAPHAKAFGDALIELFAFFLPFGVLYYVLYRYATDARRLLRLLIAFVGAGALMAAIGIVQYPTHLIIVNRAGIEKALTLEHTFRANALFWDPNIFGRFLVCVMLVGTALFLTARLRGGAQGRRYAIWLATAVLLAAVAFVVTFSRSSVAGLAIGALVLEMAWLGRRRGTIAVVVTVLILAVGLGGITVLRHHKGNPFRFDTTAGLNKITGGRVYLVKTGLRMFEHRPVAGIGLGGFPLAYAHYRTTTRAVLSLRDSHTTVVTVAAEQGLLGLAAFAALLVTFFATTLRKRRFGADRRLYLWQAALVACVLAIFVHSLSYNAFFEDPYMWVFMALASATATRIVSPPPPEAGQTLADSTPPAASAE
jgi:O-antigen ligase